MKKLLILFVIFFTSCTFSFMEQYPHAKMYQTGNFNLSESINALDINWMTDDIHVKYYQGYDIVVTETNDDRFSEEEKLHWYFDDGVLYIKFCEAGYYYTSNRKKELTVLLPYSMMLNQLTIDNCSGDVYIDEVRTRVIDIVTNSGSAYISQLNTQSANIKCSSGKIYADFACDVDNININTSSGGMDIKGSNVNLLIVNSSSGDSKMRFKSVKEFNALSSSGNNDFYFDDLDNFDISSSSGSFTLSCKKSIGNGSLTSSSGGAHLFIPNSSGFCANVKLTSGRIKADKKMLVTQTGRKEYFVSSSAYNTDTPCKIKFKFGRIEI